MANQDSSQYTLRFNEITSALEFAQGNVWLPATISNGGITSLTGDVTAGPGTGSQATALSAARLKQIFVPVASDPGTPTEGQIWYNTTSHTWKGYNGSAVVTFTVA